MFIKKKQFIYTSIISTLIFFTCSISLADFEQKPQNLVESQTIKPGEIPVGLDADSWQKIQEQILPADNPIIQKSKSASDPLYSTEVKLTASDAQADDWFGWAVAVDGDVAIVGAYKEDSVHGDRTGSAYIFERNYGGIDAWGQVKQLHGHSGYDVFGAGVAVEGDVIVVGAWGQDTGGDNAGAAYIDERNAGGINNWGEVKTLKAHDPAAMDLFGKALAVDGDVIVAGVYAKNYFTGAAYIYERNAGGINNWGEVKKLTASDSRPTILALVSLSQVT